MRVYYQQISNCCRPVLTYWLTDWWILLQHLFVCYSNNPDLNIDSERLTVIVPESDMGMCCERKMMTAWRNVWSRGSQTKRKTKEDLKQVVEKDCQARILNKEDAVDRSRWKKLIKDVWWSGWVWEGECFFWYQPTQIVPTKGPLNGCACLRKQVP